MNYIYDVVVSSDDWKGSNIIDQICQTLEDAKDLCDARDISYEYIRRFEKSGFEEDSDSDEENDDWDWDNGENYPFEDSDEEDEDHTDEITKL